MNYELAKKLKDAGYPQCGIFHGIQGWNIEGATSLATAADLVVNGNPKITLNYEPCEHITLSELIEACGDKFGTLEGRGTTPEEAVANLWLQLNATT